MKLYSPEVKTPPRPLTPAEARAVEAAGRHPIVDDFEKLLKHMFEGQPAARRDFGTQMQLRIKHPDKEWPIFTTVRFDNPTHGDCPCHKLLADMMAAIGVKVEVLLDVKPEQQNAFRALAGQ